MKTQWKTALTVLIAGTNFRKTGAFYRYLHPLEVNKFSAKYFPYKSMT